MQGWTVHALDGVIGRIDELLFDDEQWSARYLVVETGSWLAKRKVLISPLLFLSIDAQEKTLKVNLTQDKVKNSPDVATDPPISRQWEANYSDYYALPYYWVENTPAHSLGDDIARDHAAAHLRSSREVIGYSLLATDGSLGHVDDFLVDDVSWKVAYLAVATKDWWPGKKVLVPPQWIESVRWADRSVSVGASREHLKHAPEWETGQTITASFEELLQAYYAYKSPIQAPNEKTAKSSFIALYATHAEADAAIHDLQRQGFDMTKLSLIGQDPHTEDETVGYYTAGDHTKARGKTGAFWSGIWSVLSGSAFFRLPGVGPILAAGPVVVWIVGALESVAVTGGLSALGGALFSIGIPHDRVIAYETHLKAGKLLLVAHDVQGSQDTTRIAEAIERTQWK
ncbi:PRC-barrel domain-containing protein [Armatimonas rosea]|uniref:General stress protein 17M-like domain-containing protein n=1 Tax=Armatimonas rosea TaxID=685828 RepID=A0A7W9SQ64_ARMRO|nr:PRC-barrel domain-containing protein [Armatimonas rosea]MBB6050802.1 hypothetical protein [Armatimonas rosea]